MSDINLLPQDIQAAQSRKASPVQKIVIGLLVVLAIFIAIIFGASFYVNGQLGTLASKAKTLEDQIVSKQATESKLLVRNEKAIAVRNVLAQRIDYVGIFRTLKSILPDGVKFTDFSFKEGNSITINGKALSAQDLSTFTTLLLDPSKGGKMFSDVNLSSIQGREDGSFDFTVSAIVKVVGK